MGPTVELGFEAGDWLRPSCEVAPSTGPDERAAVAKGDEEEANASKPERAKPVAFELEGPEDVPNADPKDDVDDWAPLEKGDVDLAPKIFLPFIDANGELVELYAMKPPYFLLIGHMSLVVQNIAHIS